MFCTYTCQGNLHCMASKIEHFDQMSSSSYPIKQEYKSSYPHYDFGMESTRMKSLVENYVKTLPPPNKSKEMPMDKSRF